jgi:two-component system CheB/CheR fusion protein
MKRRPLKPSRSRTPARGPIAVRDIVPPAPAAPAFSIVGIGSSAGGLEALTRFLAHVPAGSGLAIVIVQHLDPTHKGMMPELLQRATPMKVVQVKDRTIVEPDHVYVIPPKKDMSLLHGVLHLLDPIESRGLRLPIDFFFRTLAQDQQERSIGVVLSGMGSDGTLGLRAIKEMAGLALVQDPATAKFDGMPRSALDAGMADIVASPEELPAKILAYLKRTPRLVPAEAPIPDKTQSAFEKAIILLRSRTGHDFSLYKHSTLVRRIERRMGIHQIAKMDVYSRYLRENPQELELLFKELLIGVTNFFRDPEVWELLREVTIPALLANHAPGGTLRAWVAGCSTGEEAYSLAMAFREAVEKSKNRGRVVLQIFATDLDPDAIAKARQGTFPANISADVSEARLKRFFVKEDKGYRVRKEIREMVVFAPQNLIMDPPFTKLDIVSCRNLLIYLTHEVQKKLMPLFHYSLNAGGVLLLGGAETVGGSTDLFEPLSAKARLFKRKETSLRPERVEFPASFNGTRIKGSEGRPVAPPPASLQVLADQLVLHRHAPPAVLANDRGDIFYISGRTGKYLEPAAGKANWNLFVMARDGLRQELPDAFLRTMRQEESIVLKGIKVGTNGGAQWVDVTIQRIDETGPLLGLVLVVFTDVMPPASISVDHSARASKKSARHGRREELERELRRIRTESLALQEGMQTSHEELRSANEELQSTNEELQSTNEELTTSTEEMQSMNEELQTLNAELQAKVSDLSRASDDMKNLLNSTDIATLFLDDDFNVRRFTPQAATIIKLLPGDVGRPVTDLTSELEYPALLHDARAVLHTLDSSEKPICARDGRWFSVRIMPYRTVDDRVNGVVITFADITVAKTLEAKLLAKQAGLERRFTNEAPKRVRSKGRRAGID